jgi:dCMP deaminase
MITCIKQKSKDPSTKVGCVIAGPDHGFISAGFNGFARGVKDNPQEVPERYERNSKLLYTVHAENNAIFAAGKRGVALDGSIIYMDWYPCAHCMQGIIQTGIKEIVINRNSESYKNTDLLERWKDHIQASKNMANEAGVVIRYVDISSI